MTLSEGRQMTGYERCFLSRPIINCWSSQRRASVLVNRHHELRTRHFISNLMIWTLLCVLPLVLHILILKRTTQFSTARDNLMGNKHKFTRRMNICTLSGSYCSQPAAQIVYFSVLRAHSTLQYCIYYPPPPPPPPKHSSDGEGFLHMAHVC